MPKYWGKQIFSLGRFPEVGQKQKTEKREEERPKVGNNITMASYALQRHLNRRMQSPLGQYKPTATVWLCARYVWSVLCKDDLFLTMSGITKP